jgi:group I intron endonuclease
MENTYCIYKIINPKGFVYIGQTKHVKRRLNAYKYPNSIKLQVFIHNSILKYGFKNHIIEIMYENLSHQEANIKEIKEIAKYKALNISLNISDGGQLVSRTRHVPIMWPTDIRHFIALRTVTPTPLLEV